MSRMAWKVSLRKATLYEKGTFGMHESKMHKSSIASPWFQMPGLAIDAGSEEVYVSEIVGRKPDDLASNRASQV
ncbi:hypothetical protein J1614_005623 [Plenodomus biglobosus]|nr:hypothetical protein J1614_005623 [Plenodomus biglobosus]